MTLSATVLTDVDQLTDVLPGWDALAVETQQPFCAPGWMTAWWLAAAPRDAALRVVVARRDGNVIGVAPMYLERDRLGVRRLRFLAAPASLRTEPLARRGHEEELARAVVRELAARDESPDVVFFDGVADDSPWPEIFAGSLSEPPAWTHTHMRLPAPLVRISHEDGEGWLSSKSKNFREQTRRRRRKLEAEGAVFRMSRSENVASDLEALARLHHSRWDEKGGSGVLTPQVEEMLRRAADELLDGDRFRLWVIDVGGKVISAHLFLGAGGELSYWLGGFDDRWAVHQPALQVLIVALQDAIDRGEERLDLGGGAQPYKYRLSDSEEGVRWTTVIPKGPRHLLARAVTSPRHLRRAFLSRIPDDMKDRVKKALGRPVSAGAGKQGRR